MNEISHTRVIESESATTDHEHNHVGATPVVVSLVILGALAFVSFFLTMTLATSAASVAKYRLNTNPTFGLQYDYDDWDLDNPFNEWNFYYSNLVH